ncbi:mCG1028112, isoform CRA_b [Mus musculus]|nr:mCG1028112, isoform CRA_b [Mus musculus]
MCFKDLYHWKVGTQEALMRPQNKKSWRKLGGDTWNHFSHSLNCCCSQVRPPTRTILS